MMNELLLLSGNDIPFPEAQVTIHQPRIYEIAYIGEEAFYTGCGFLDFSKKILDDKDKVRLSNYTDFNILMSIMISKDSSVKHNIENALLVLSLLFPLYEIGVRADAIVLKQNDKEYLITEKNFDAFKKILQSIFSLGNKNNESDYNPSDSMAKRIAEKFKKRQEQLKKLANEKSDSKKFDILSRYVSILAVGAEKDINSLMNYTVYQLYNEFQRFQLKVQWDAYLQARMAGAQDLDEVDNWMIDLDKVGQNKTNKK